MLIASLLGCHSLLGRLVAAASAAGLLVLHAVERQFQWQDFKHYRNH